MDDMIGHNAPPRDLLLEDALRERLFDENLALVQRRDALLEAGQRITDINNDEIAAKAGDFIKQIMAVVKAAEAARISEKEPYLDGGRQIDGFFKKISEPLERFKRGIEHELTFYLRGKAETERLAREEQKRLAREEEDRMRREAQEAADKLRDEKTLKLALTAEKRWQQAEADRIAAEKAAQAKPADLSRTRGEYGAVSSLRTLWTFSDLDRETLDLEALRFHLPMDGLERAVRALIKAGGRELKGVKIFETTDAVVR